MDHTLGMGKYGVVKQAHQNDNPDFKVAIKRIELSKLSGNYHSCISEIITLQKVDHPNIVKIYEIFKDEENLYIVMELLKGKELFQHVVEHSKISEKDSVIIVEQILRALKHLNSLNICHRDIKPENVLIDPNTLKIKLCDFGLSTFYNSFEMMHTKVGTPYYVSPEVLRGNYHKKCDIWSVGCLTYVLLTGCPPFQGEDLAEVYDEILHQKLKLYKQDWENLSKYALDFVKGMLRKNPDHRLSPDEALKHPFITRKTKIKKVKPSVLKRLITRSEDNSLKREIFTILSTYIKEEVLERWNSTFKELDVESTGAIKISEVLRVMRENNIDATRLTHIEKMVDLDPNVTISYSDFLTKVISMRKIISEKEVENVFKQLDTDKSGKIGVSDLNSFMERKGKFGLDAKALIQQVDSKRFSMDQGLVGESTG